MLNCIGIDISKSTLPIGFDGGVNTFLYVGANPVGRVDESGLIILPSNFPYTYPKSYIRISTIEQRVTFNMLFAAQEYGQVSSEDFMNSLSVYLCTLPTVKPAHLQNAYGEFTPNSNSTEIRISISLLEDYEKGNAKDPILDATIMHEIIHYFDDLDGIDYPGEEGELWEKASYGKVIYP